VTTLELEQLDRTHERGVRDERVAGPAEEPFEGQARHQSLELAGDGVGRADEQQAFGDDVGARAGQWIYEAAREPEGLEPRRAAERPAVPPERARLTDALLG
jgi:hypothetical protein